MRPIRRLAPFVLSLLFVAADGRAETAVDAAAGHWEGAIELPGMDLQVVVDLAVDAAGRWSGAIDIPAQGATRLPLGGFTVDGDALVFAIAGVPGEPTFRGVLADDGATLAGPFTQGALAATFRLVRAAPGADFAATALAGFREQVEGILEALHVPGAGVAVVRGDEIVFLEGFGLRDREAGLPATPDTLFAIGSSSKAFTTLLLGSLVDEGRLDWDAPAVSVLPELRLSEPMRTELLTVRDLVTHRSGLPRHDLVWYRAHLERAEIVRRLRFLDPSAGLRERWQYQNGMFVAAGTAAERLGGASWEELVRRRILDPLGMTRSNFSVVDSQLDADFAQPYKGSKEAIERVPFQEIPEAGPAGSINSSAREMAAWLRLQLGGGEVDGRRIVAAATLAEMHRVQTPMDDPVLDPEILNRGYGLGWFVEVYRGRKRVHHGGNIDGFSAQVALLPNERIGVVVLTNANGTPAPEIVARVAADRLLELEPIDWLARIKARLDAAEAAGERAGELAETYDRRPDAPPAHPLAEYAGEYEHPAYGVVRVDAVAGDSLAATFHDIPIALEPWHYETFRGTTDDPTLSELKLYFLFRTDAKGEIDALSVPLEPAVDPIVFAKRPPARLSDPVFLATLTGRYALTLQPAVTIDVSLRGSRLAASVLGQPPYELIPMRGTEFRLKGLTGFSLRFLLDESGAVERVLLLQPDGVYEATPKAP